MTSIQRKISYTPKAPVRQGIYSQAVVVDRTMYISGQLGLDTASGQLVSGGVEAQAKQALINMGEILKTAGCGYENVIKTTVLLANINDFTKVNEVYQHSSMLMLIIVGLGSVPKLFISPHHCFSPLLQMVFTDNFPARAAYQVAALPRGGLVEIKAVAVLGPISDAS